LKIKKFIWQTVRSYRFLLPPLLGVLSIAVKDAEFLGMGVEKSTVGSFVYVDKKLMEMLFISDTSQHLKVPLKSTSQKLQIVVKDLGGNEESHGSISFDIPHYFSEGPGPCK